MELKERVKAARNHAGLTQGELVQRVKQLPGVDSFSQQALTKLETGASKKSAYLSHIAMVCNVDASWLATGIGEMVGNGVNDKKASYNAKLLFDTEKLDPEIKSQMLKLIAAIEKGEISKERFLSATSLLFPE